MQLGNTFQGKKCARCRQVIQSDPAFDDDLWYHRTCLEAGIRALQRAHALAVHFGVVPTDSQTLEEQQSHEAAARLMAISDRCAPHRDSAR
jgi:hypothetical protein